MHESKKATLEKVVAPKPIARRKSTDQSYMFLGSSNFSDMILRKATLSNIAETLEQSGQRGEALKYYKEALQLDPTCGGSAFLYGKALFNSGDKVQALQLFQNTMASNPSKWQSDYDFMFALGVIHFQSNQFKSALEQFKKASLQPDLSDTSRAEVYFLTGLCHEHMSHILMALTCYDQSLQLNPSNENVLWFKLLALIKLEQWSDAVAASEQFLALKPNHTKAMTHLQFAKQKLEEQTNKYATSTLD
jgi:tetratricopeptide (TPR) repeat protein